MATYRLPILGFGTRPDGSSKCWEEPLPILATNDVWGRMIYRFDEDGNNNAQLTTRVGLHGGFAIPENYVGTPKIVIVWSATVTSGNCVWDFDYRAVGGDDSESLDQAGTQESVSVTDVAPSSAWNRLEAEVALTAGNLAAEDEVEFTLFVDGTDGSDTLAGARILFNLFFEYADV